MTSRPLRLFHSSSHPLRLSHYTFIHVRPNLSKKGQAQFAKPNEKLLRPKGQLRPAATGRYCCCLELTETTTSRVLRPSSTVSRRYPIRPIPSFAGAWRGKQGRAMAGAFALRLVPRLAAEPPGRGKGGGGGGGASRDAVSRAL